MTTSGAYPLDIAAPAAPRRPAAGWVESPAYDLSFFILAPALTLPLVVGSLLGWRLAALAGFSLAFGHYMTTFSFFFWDENRLRHRTRWAAFLGGPVFIFAAFWLLFAFEVPVVVQLVLFFWNTYHVALQSCGLVSIYRHRAGVLDPGQKATVARAVLSANLWFALWNIETHEEIAPVLAALSPRLADALRLALGVVAALFLARLARSLLDRSAAGRGARLPELGAILAALLLFHPYLWARSSEAATFAMLLPHYVQYLALVWLLHRRKFRQAAGSLPQRLLQRVSSSTPALVTTLLALSLGFLALKPVLGRMGHGEAFEALYLLLAFEHFYLDGLFWAFKDPHVRRSMAPYLTGATGADPLAVAGEALVARP
jgi:hypothetical protein